MTKAISSTFALSINSVTPKPADADFLNRSTAPGVLFASSFDSAADLGTDQTFGNTAFGWLPGSSANPFIDTTIKCSGAASLGFKIPSLSGSNAGGAWFASFPLVDDNAEVYVQMRTFWNQALWDTIFLDADGSQQSGTKIFDIAAGNVPGGAIQWSSANLKTVVQTYYQTRLLELYAYDYAGSNEGFFERIPNDFKLQNAMPSPFCLYTNATGNTGNINGCFNVMPLEWMTWQLGMTMLGRRTLNGKSVLDFRARLWGARQGQPSQLLVDWNPNTNSYFPLRAQDDDGTPLHFGKLWAFPYITAKSLTQVHQFCQANYDEIIVSSQRITDPL